MTHHSRLGLRHVFLSSFAALLLLTHEAAADEAEIQAEAEEAAADAQAAADEQAAADAQAAADEQAAADAQAASTADTAGAMDTQPATEVAPEVIGVLYAIFTVAEPEPERLTIALGTTKARDKALAAWRTGEPPGIPTGRLVCQRAEYNTPWDFYVEPTSTGFAEVTITFCSARPSYVSANCASFGEGRYCPQNAELVELRECPDAITPVATCPLVPRP